VGREAPHSSFPDSFDPVFFTRFLQLRVSGGAKRPHSSFPDSFASNYSVIIWYTAVIISGSIFTDLIAFLIGFLLLGGNRGR